MVFSPRPSAATSLLRPDSKGQNAMTGVNHFSYEVSIDGVEVRHPKVNTKSEPLVGHILNAPESSRSSGIEEIISGSIADEVSNLGTESEIEVPARLPINIRRKRPLPNLRLASDPEPSNKTPQRPETQEPSHVSPYLPGQERYEVIDEIGNDSEGPCTLVRRVSDGELRVIKTVKWPILAHGKPIEARILHDIFPRLHDNIIYLHAYEFVEAPAIVRYHLEYCSGGDLYDLCTQYEVHEAWFPELFIWKVFLEIADALDFLHHGFDQKGSHRPGVVHRDIKPSNIFLRRSPHSTAYPDAVLADFGSASFLFASYEPAGTFLWQPPEIPRKAPRGDVWGLGAVIHNMIHLAPPILALPDDIEPTDENTNRWYMKPEIRQIIPETPEKYSQQLFDVMNVALEMDHLKRATSSRLMSILTAIMEQQYPPNGDKIANPEPLAPWAFDHATFGDKSSNEPEHYDADLGSRQYFDMMNFFECSSPASPNASIGDTF